MIGQCDAKSGFFKNRLPYLLLAPASLSILYFLIEAGEAASEGSSFIPNVGLFFFSGSVQCSSLRISYFLLHLQMSLLISIISKANRSTAFGIPAIVRRVAFFSLGYAAVGIAAPLTLAFTGDAGILDGSHVDGASHSSPPPPVDDSDFDTYTTMFVNFGWWTHIFWHNDMRRPVLAYCINHRVRLLCHRMGLLHVAAIAFLSQEGSSARVLAPLRLLETRQWLPRPALMNAFFVCAFATKELVPYNALQADPSFILGLEPLQQPHGGTPRQPVHDADHGRFRASPPRLLWRHARLGCFALPPRCTPPLSIQDERFSKTQMTAHGVPCA